MNNSGQGKVTVKRKALMSVRPDLKNQNKIKQTSSPLKQVKKYFQTIKKHPVDEHHSIKKNGIEEYHLQNNNPLILISSDQQNIKELPYNQEQYLRNRIEQLQMENNELRYMFKEYEGLALRNKELEEQMLQLLDEIQNREKQKNNCKFYQTYQGTQQNQQHGFSFSQKGTPLSKQIQTKPTQISTFRQIDIQILRQDSPQVKDFSSMNSLRQKQLQEENGWLKQQNKRVYDLLENSMKEYLHNIEKKFTEYIQTIDKKFNRIQIQRPTINSNFKIYQQYNHYVEKQREIKQKQFSQIEDRFNKNIFPSRLKDVQYYHDVHVYCTPVGSNLQISPSHQSINQPTSKVNILLQNSDYSELAYKQKQQQRHQISPVGNNSNNIDFNNIKKLSYSKSQDLKFQHLVVEKIFQNISYLRENLTYLWNKKNILSDSFSFLEKRIQSQLNNILSSYFQQNKHRTPIKQSTRPNQKDVWQQNASLKQKIQQINEEINYLRLQLSFKMDSQTQNQSSKRNNEVQISRRKVKLSIRRASQELKEQDNVHRQFIRQFEVSKKKLMDIIEVIRAFNDGYVDILRKSSRNSLIEDLKHQY